MSVSLSLTATASFVLLLIALFASAVMAVFRGPLSRWLDAQAPSQRAQWLVGLLALPGLVGSMTLVAALGHCGLHWVAGTPEDCGARCTFCLFHETPSGTGVWLVAVGFVLWAVWRWKGVLQGLWYARRLALRLRTLGRPVGEGHWEVPGASSYVLGLLRPVVCLGEELRASLDERAVRAVLAHERAHVAGRDAWLRLGAHALALFHLPAFATWLQAQLELAQEQHCDELASEDLSDRLAVAEALLQVVAVQQRQGELPQRAVPATLPARIAQLCSPVAPPKHALAPWHWLCLVALGGSVGLIAIGHELHGWIEGVARLLWA